MVHPRCRYEGELAIRQSVEADIAGLRKVIDDTNMSRLQLESEIENLKEELIYMKKNHEEVRPCRGVRGEGEEVLGSSPHPRGSWLRVPTLQEAKSLQAQVSGSGLTVEVDAPKTHDLGKIMADIRAQYEALAQKNREDLDKYWNQQVSFPRPRPSPTPVLLGPAAREIPHHHPQDPPILPCACRSPRAPSRSPRAPRTWTQPTAPSQSCAAPTRHWRSSSSPCATWYVPAAPVPLTRCPFAPSTLSGGSSTQRGPR